MAIDGGQTAEQVPSLVSWWMTGSTTYHSSVMPKITRARRPAPCLLEHSHTAARLLVSVALQ